MNILATVILAYFFLREIHLAVGAYRNGHAPIWLIVGAFIAFSLLIPLWQVWS